MFLEFNALYALGEFSRTATIAFLIITVIAAIISLVCYLLYYNLDSTKGYIDGMIPLLLTAIMMIAAIIGVVAS